MEISTEPRESKAHRYTIQLATEGVTASTAFPVATSPSEAPSAASSTSSASVAASVGVEEPLSHAQTTSAGSPVAPVAPVDLCEGSAKPGDAASSDAACTGSTTKIPLIRTNTDGTRTLHLTFAFPYYEGLRWTADFPYETVTVGDIVDALHAAWPFGPSVPRGDVGELQVMLMGTKLLPPRVPDAREQKLCKLPPVERAVDMGASQLVFHAVIRPLDTSPEGSDRDACTCVIS